MGSSIERYENIFNPAAARPPFEFEFSFKTSSLLFPFKIQSLSASFFKTKKIMQVYNIILGEVSFIIATLYKVVHNVCALKCASVHALDSMLMMVGHHHTAHSFV